MNKNHRIAWKPVMAALETGSSVRVIAVDLDGEKLPDANLLKFKPDGTLYPYHTINTGLGFDTDSEGRLSFLGTI